MNQVAVIFVLLLTLIAVLSTESNGNFTGGNATAAQYNRESELSSAAKTFSSCSPNDFCCKLGRKAVRRAYSSLYTCKIEALIEGLEYHTSVSHRLRLIPRSREPAADRMKAASTLHASYGFRSRLHLCQNGRSPGMQCFQDCCERKLSEKQAKARAKATRKGQDST